MRGSWDAVCTELLGEHGVRLGSTAQKKQVSSHLTFGSEIQANDPVWWLLEAGTSGTYLEIPSRAWHW